MILLIPALLLAAVLWQPWTHIELPGDDVHAQTVAVSAATPEEEAHFRTLKLDAAGSRALRLRAAQPAAPEAAEQTAVLAEAIALVTTPFTGDLEDLVCSFAWPCEEALTIARCESGTDLSGRLNRPEVTNGTSYGLFQINAIHASRFPGFWEAWMDPVTNANWAFELWSERGWQPWSCFPY